MPKKLNRNKLIEILRKIDEKLTKKVLLIAIGGTALNLMGLKKATFDVDFIIDDPDEYLKVDLIAHIYEQGFETQIQNPGTIVMYEMPKDYKRKSIEDKKLNAYFSKIKIKILNPLDIIITKLGRFDPKDIEDITNILIKFKYPFKDIEKRFNEFYLLYRGNKQNFMNNYLAFKELYKEIIK